MAGQRLAAKAGTVRQGSHREVRSRSLHLPEFGHKSPIWPQKRRASLEQSKQSAEDETHPDRWEQPKAWGRRSVGGGDISRSITSCLLEGENSVERHTQFKQVI